jgi:tetratricopeptide (TPR) repeat protein
MRNLLSRWSVGDSSTSRLADGVRYLRGGSLDRAWTCFEQAAERTRDPRVRSEAYRRLADVKRRRAEWEEALQLSAAALEVATEHGLSDESAAALNIEGSIHHQQGDFSRAIRVYEQALAAQPRAHQRGMICQNLGTAFAQKGLRSEAAEWYARSSAAFRMARLPREELLALMNQGNVRLDQGEFQEAEALFRKALARVERLPSRDAELYGLIEMNLAEALGRQGNHLDFALQLVLSATGHFAASQNQPYRVASHRVVALIFEKQGELDTAVGALERGGVLAREIGNGPEIAYFEREISRLSGETRHPPAEGTEVP